jgi:alkanesulfonate monooxygenase SsuD/methylene tetrahydromethanopterin reductase-like flavin-dependent oxidoreductase (luciferase family)
VSVSGGAPLEFGIILGDAPISVSAQEHVDSILRQVEVAQEQGFTYICIGQHFLYDGYRWLQPIPLLSRLVPETGPEVRLVTSMVLLPFYHPVVLAEELATVDVLSGGRLIVGVGAGYRHAEFEHFNVRYDERFSRLEEGLELMKLAWKSEPFDFEGRHWQIRNATPHVVPLQRPHPLIWMGAMRQVGIRRAARTADSWMVTPEMPFWEVEQSRQTFATERIKHQLPAARLPIRREVVIGKDRNDALRIYEKRARSRYLAYAGRGQNEMDRHDGNLADSFREWAIERAIFGTADECADTLEALDTAAFGPLIVRPSWPGMTSEDVVAYLRQIGTEIITPLRDKASVSTPR